MPCTLVDLPQAKGSSPQDIMQKEAKGQLAAIPNNAYVIILDEHGQGITTQKLAKNLATWQQNGQDVCFIIGGAEGLAADVKAKAKLTLKLSDFTLPHQMAKVIVLEQLYRAATILAGHPYHRE